MISVALMLSCSARNSRRSRSLVMSSAARDDFVTTLGGAASVGLGVSFRVIEAAHGPFEGGAGDADAVRSTAGVEAPGEGAAELSSSLSSTPKESFPLATGSCFFFFFLGGPADSFRGVRALYFVH